MGIHPYFNDAETLKHRTKSIQMYDTQYLKLSFHYEYLSKLIKYFDLKISVSTSNVWANLIKISYKIAGF